MLFILILLLIPVYLVAGVKVARNRYALENVRYRAQAELIDEYTARNAELRAFVHAGYCNLAYHSMRYKGCDCSPDYQRRKREVDSLRAKLPPSPAAPTKTMFSWPAYVLDSYLKSGEVKGYVPELTEMLEREVRGEL